MSSNSCHNSLTSFTYCRLSARSFERESGSLKSPYLHVLPTSQSCMSNCWFLTFPCDESNLIVHLERSKHTSPPRYVSVSSKSTGTNTELALSDGCMYSGLVVFKVSLSPVLSLSPVIAQITNHRINNRIVN